jgi:xanthine dehydrogenase accessory factor
VTFDLDNALLNALATQRAVRIVVTQTQGSVPRDAGTWMAVVDSQTALIGTIGGGRLEHDAVAHAQALLEGKTQLSLRRFALGPSLGQCCGGVVDLRFELHDTNTVDTLRAALSQERDADAMPVALFGGGHVGRAIARALAVLPVKLHWIDSRDEIFPTAQALGLEAWPDHVKTEHSQPVQQAVRDLAPGSHVLIMSFSHAEDFDILMACLQRQSEHKDLPFVGLIGSKTKWATFRHRLKERGYSDEQIGQITCPIGLSSIHGKEPQVIAASVAAQLLGRRQAMPT